MKEEIMTVDVGNYRHANYKTIKENKNGDLYMIIDSVVTTLAGYVVARKIREYWTDHRLDRFYGKEHIFQTQTVVKDEIGYFSEKY